MHRWSHGAARCMRQVRKCTATTSASNGIPAIMTSLAFEHAMERLGAQLVSGLLSTQAYADAVAHLLRPQLRCARLELWRVSGSAGCRVLVCLAACAAPPDHGITSE